MKYGRRARAYEAQAGQPPHRIGDRILVGLLIAIVLGLACGTPETETEPTLAMTDDLTEELVPGADNMTIAQHMLEAKSEARTTRALALHYADMDRRRAYAIQTLMLQEREKMERRVGWKIGYSLQVPDQAMDAIFGHVMESNVMAADTPLNADDFPNGTSYVEAEIAMWLNQDLPGPTVSREELAEAVSEVSGVVELLSSHVQGPTDEEPTRAQAVADNVFHIGLIFAPRRVKPNEVDITSETGKVVVDGEVQAEGEARSIMGSGPFDALLWLANELPKYGHHLHAGDFVITGTFLPPPPITAGQEAEVMFSTLGSVTVEMKPTADRSTME